MSLAGSSLSAIRPSSSSCRGVWVPITFCSSDSTLLICLQKAGDALKSVSDPAYLIWWKTQMKCWNYVGQEVKDNCKLFSISSLLLINNSPYSWAHYTTKVDMQICSQLSETMDLPAEQLENKVDLSITVNSQLL